MNEFAGLKEEIVAYSKTIGIDKIGFVGSVETGSISDGMAWVTMPAKS